MNTSLKTYQDIVDTGLLSKMRLLVLREVATCNSCDLSPTASEVSKYLKIQIRSVSPRLKELSDMQLITCTTRECSVTGREANAYYLTGNVIAKDLPKKKSNKEIIKELEEEIRCLYKVINSQVSQIGWLKEAAQGKSFL